MGTKTMRRLGALGGAAALLLATACGDSDADQADGGDTRTAENESQGGGGEFEASPGYLSQVVDESTGQSFSYEMTMEMSMGGDTIDFGAPIATGQTDGDRQHMRMDMGVMFEAMLGEMGGSEELPEGFGGDMSIEYVIDTDAMYIRAPIFASMFGEMPGGTAELGEAGDLLGAFGQLGDGWGKVDLSALGDVLPGQAAGSLGGQAYDPQVFLEMIRSSESVEELGTDEIDGVPVSGVAAEVSMVDMLDAQGMSPEDAGGSSVDLTGATFPLEVWVDGDDLIRRITFTFDDESLADAAAATGQDVAEGDIDALGGVGVTMAMDFSGYGEPVDIEVPSGDEVVDITDDFVSGYEAIEELGTTGVGVPS